jgi:hypothetical protein
MAGSTSVIGLTGVECARRLPTRLRQILRWKRGWQLDITAAINAIVPGLKERLTRMGDNESHLADVSRDLLPGEERQGSIRRWPTKLDLRGPTRLQST